MLAFAELLEACAVGSIYGNSLGTKGRRAMTRIGMALAAAALWIGSAQAVELDPKAVVYTLPENVKWVVNERAGNAQAVIAGDPTKPGLYVVLTKWLAGNHFSRPHFHPNDRFITVIKGTWWVGSGPNFDPANST